MMLYANCTARGLPTWLWVSVSLPAAQGCNWTLKRPLVGLLEAASFSLHPVVTKP